MLTALVLAITNNFINSLLSEILTLDEIFNKNYLKLNNKTIKIVHFKDFYLQFKDDSIKISTDNNDLSYDLLINISVPGILSANFNSLQYALQNDDLTFIGNFNLALILHSCFTSLDINLLEFIQYKLAQKTSALFAWQVINLLKLFTKRLNNHVSNTKEQLVDYLQIEKNILINKSQAKIFYNKIDILKQDVDRLSARINLLIC